MAVFTIVTTFADAVVASKRVHTNSSVLTRTVKTFVKIYNRSNRAKNNILFVCLFVYCNFFVRHLRNTILLQISITGLFQLTIYLPKIYVLLLSSEHDCFLLKLIALLDTKWLHIHIQIVTTQLVQTANPATVKPVLSRQKIVIGPQSSVAFPVK